MTTLATPCQLRRSADSVQDRDACDLAQEVVDLARAEGVPVLLTIDPHGTAKYALLSRVHALEDAMEHEPLSIVGIYTKDASVEDVQADILAMPRGTECAP